MALDDFIEFVIERAGDSLRVIGWYEDENAGVFYARGDLDRDTAATRVKADQDYYSQGSKAEPLSDLRATVDVRDRAVIIHFPVTGDRGLIVSLEHDAANHLVDFVTECRVHLSDDEMRTRRASMEGA